jgi:hypothetical protein
MSDTQVVDFLGRAIQLGAVIVFPVRKGSMMKLKQATVWDVLDSGQVVAQVPGQQNLSKIDRSDRCIVIA